MAQAAPKTPLSGVDLTGRRLGRYEVLYLLASGGMATVYVARAKGVAGFERLVAIKVLHAHLAHDEDFISMFLDEARLAARIRHPNVVGTLDISDSQGDGYFLVMEYVEGDHFGNLLRNAAKGGERLPVPVVARIMMDSLTGLYAAHHLTDSTGQPLDLVHRDLSPHNILVGHDGIARITDFGVAKAQVRLSSTRDGQFKGKLSYMAPEQAASGQASQRSDLFSMGIVLWESLTGRRLFRGENNGEVLNKILNPQVPLPSQLDPDLAPFDAVTSKALAKEPEHRFQDAEEFLEAIEEAARQLGGVATPRAVGRVVTQWLGEKVESERKAIGSAIDALGRSELQPGVLPRPMESGSHSSAVRTIPPEDATVAAKPSTLNPNTQRGGNPLLIPLVAVVLLSLVGGGLGAWALVQDRDEPAAVQPAGVQPAAQPPGPESERPDALDPNGDPATPTGAADEPAGETGAIDGEPTTLTDGADGTDGTDEDLGTGDADAEPVEADETGTAGDREAAERAARARRRHRRRRGRRAQESTAPSTEGSSSSGTTAPATPEDDLILNPYRRR